MPKVYSKNGKFPKRVDEAFSFRLWNYSFIALKKGFMCRLEENF